MMKLPQDIVPLMQSKRIMNQEQGRAMLDMLRQIEKGEIISEEERPNLHAIGFMMDIIDSLEKRVRGPALESLRIKNVENSLDKSEAKGVVFPLLKDEITEFIEKVNDKLNEKFGMKNEH